MAFQENLKNSIRRRDHILLGCFGRFHGRRDICVRQSKDLEKSLKMEQRPYLEIVGFLKQRAEGKNGKYIFKITLVSNSRGFVIFRMNRCLRQREVNNCMCFKRKPHLQQCPQPWKLRTFPRKSPNHGPTKPCGIMYSRNSPLFILFQAKVHYFLLLLLPKFLKLRIGLYSCFLSGEMENSCLPFSL